MTCFKYLILVLVTFTFSLSSPSLHFLLARSVISSLLWVMSLCREKNLSCFSENLSHSAELEWTKSPLMTHSEQ